MIPELHLEILINNLRKQIFWITPCIAQGAFPNQKQLSVLAEEGITHILNVGTAPPEEKQNLFEQIIWQPFPDLIRIPDKTAIDCLDALHTMLSYENSKIYIHCVAGQNRSATILWLYFVACGMSIEIAKEMISRATLDAVPGHPKLIDLKLIKLVKKYGKKHFTPLSRLEILIPIGIE